MILPSHILELPFVNYCGGELGATVRFLHCNLEFMGSNCGNNLISQLVRVRLRTFNPSKTS